MDTIKPRALQRGDTIGVFTPSLPANVLFREKYLHGLSELRRLGFRVVEGELTRAGTSEGYRSGSPQERADEFMRLILDPNVRALVATMGGHNSASLIPYLDFDAIRTHAKIVCGFSDITSLHLASLRFAGLRNFYGPTIVTSFGEWPHVLDDTRDSFLSAVSDPTSAPRPLTPPAQWSDHFRDATTGAWRTEPRRYNENPGWRALCPGIAIGPAIVANLETLLAAAGTPYFPDLGGKVLVIEELSAPHSLEERAFRQLERMGIFDAIAGLIVGKPERSDQQGAPFSYEQLILEVVGSTRRFPIITNFDCGHTHPMLTIAEMTEVSMHATTGFDTRVIIQEPMVVQ
jgi:muramoyltetrapeptide carboxypeptidase